jgi:hypothetical protein
MWAKFGNRELSLKFGVPVGSIAHHRYKLNKPITRVGVIRRTRIAWHTVSEEEWDKLTPREISKKLGCTPEMVKMYRSRMGSPTEPVFVPKSTPKRFNPPPKETTPPKEIGPLGDKVLRALISLWSSSPLTETDLQAQLGDTTDDFSQWFRQELVEPGHVRNVGGKSRSLWDLAYRVTP